MNAPAWVGFVASILGIAALIGAGIVVFRSAAAKATAELWRGEAEAQKARGDRLEQSMTDLTHRVEKLEEENKTLRSIATSGREITALTAEIGHLRDEVRLALVHATTTSASHPA